MPECERIIICRLAWTVVVLVGGGDWGVSILLLHSWSLPIGFHGSLAEAGKEICNEDSTDEVKTEAKWMSLRDRRVRMLL